MAESRQVDIIALVCNEIERDQLKTLADNPSLMNALKKVLLAAVYYNGTLREGVAVPDPTLNAALALAFQKDISNEQLGQDVRGLAEGVRLVKFGFDKIDELKTSPTPAPAQPNKAR